MNDTLLESALGRIMALAKTGAKFSGEFDNESQTHALFESIFHHTPAVLEGSEAPPISN